MNLLIFLFVIAIIVFVIIGKPMYIYLGLTVIMLITCGLMILIFSTALILLLFSKRRKARFVRIDLPYRSDKYKCAYYRIYDDNDQTGEDQIIGEDQKTGDEYPCIFPEEGLLRRKLYREDRDCTVFVLRRFKRVFDRYAVMTTILGLTFSLGMGILLLSLFI